MLPKGIFKKLTPEVELLTAIAKVPHLDGYEVTVTFTSADSVKVPHSLGRPYTGGLIYWVSDPSSAPAISVESPRLAASQVDITKYFIVGAGTTWSGTLRIWIF